MKLLERWARVAALAPSCYGHPPKQRAPCTTLHGTVALWQLLPGMHTVGPINEVVSEIQDVALFIPS